MIFMLSNQIEMIGGLTLESYRCKIRVEILGLPGNLWRLRLVYPARQRECVCIITQAMVGFEPTPRKNVFWGWGRDDRGYSR